MDQQDKFFREMQELLPYYILESSEWKDKAIKALSASKNFYSHILKWKYQTNKQSVSWVKTIIESYSMIDDCIYYGKRKTSYNDLNVNTTDYINNNLRKIYDKGVVDAIKETGITIIKNDINLKGTTLNGYHNSIFLNFNNIIQLNDINLIVDLMMEYCTEYSYKYLQNNKVIEQRYSGRYKGTCF